MPAPATHERVDGRHREHRSPGTWRLRDPLAVLTTTRNCRQLAIATLLLGLAWAGCEAAGQDSADGLGGGEAELRVMTFNIEWGGTHVSFDKAVEAIRRSGADIVGVQEAEGNLARLAGELGWHFDERNYIVSRFPLLDPPGGDGLYLLAEVRPGQVMAMANLHLPSDPYGPDLVRDGAGLGEVLANERAVRVPALKPYLDKLPALAETGMPLLVTGDFNSPAHMDWTADMVGRRPFLRYPVAWPVSVAMQQAGFEDAWRAVYPDPAARPGLTWWAARPPLAAYAPGENDAQDRIDQIWFAGPVTPLAAQLVGEPGGPGVSIEVSPWPSDHRGVVARVRVRPAPLPALLTTDRRVYREGAEIRVRHHFHSLVGDETEIMLVGGDQAGTPDRALAPHPTGTLSLAAPPPGRYRFTASVAGAELEREFWVLGRDAETTLEPARARFGVHEPVTVRWRNAPGLRNDYVALYRADAADEVEGMLAYAYLGARPEGQLDLRSAVFPGGGGLQPGRYITRLLKDDGYAVLAETRVFEVGCAGLADCRGDLE